MIMNAKQGVVLRHPKVSHEDLVELLRGQTPDEGNAWFIVARIDNKNFGDFDKSKADKLVEEWTQGRVFWKTCEIRWHRSPEADTNDVFVLCEDAALTLEGFQTIGENWQAVAPGENANLVAWGSPPDESRPYIRAESRLPERLHYPVSCKAGKVKCLYYRAPSGEVQFIRLTEVE